MNFIQTQNNRESSNQILKALKDHYFSCSKTLWALSAHIQSLDDAFNESLRVLNV